MSSPVRRGKKSVIYFRKAIPEELWGILGRKEVKISLRTSDDALARPEHARLNAEWEARFQALRKSVTKLTHMDVVAPSGALYSDLVDTHQNDPDPRGHRSAQEMMAAFLADEPGTVLEGSGPLRDKVEQTIEGEHRQQVEKFVAEQGVNAPAADLDRVVEVAKPAVHEAQKRLVLNAKGKYPPDAVREAYPKWVAPVDRVAGPGEDVPLKYDLIAIYELMHYERQLASSTDQKWRPIIEKVAEEHPDVRSINSEWCVGWKDRLVAQGYEGSSVKDGYLAALRSVLNYAVSNKRIDANPMDGITIKVKKKQLTRESKGYTLDEALVVLRATHGRFSNLLPVDQQAARRWAPWLAAFTGARIGEITQLRKQDIHNKDGVWLVWITPEAGPVKAGNARYAAIHPQLLHQGFIEFVEACPRDTLFCDARRQLVDEPRRSSASKAAENLSRWVRSLGLRDEQLQPNHGWRHRFKTQARKVGMDAGTRDYIQGHVAHNEAEAYGDYEYEVLYREISKLPYFKLD